MSTRSRTRPAARSYTARLQERAAAPRRRKQSRVGGPIPPALLALCAELGHLGAAFAEWPSAWVRGLVHVLAGGALGLLAVNVYFGPVRRTAGIVLAVALPAGWLGGALVGLSPYREFPVVAAVALVILELAIAGLLAARRR